MKYTAYTSSWWYSVIAAVVLVGFLLVLVSGVFQLVLLEMNDNRGRENYLRASAGAEWALELALLKIKKIGYGYHDEITNDVNDASVMISDNPLDASDFGGGDTAISYSMDGKVGSYTGQLDALSYDIIPLFYLDETDEHKVTELTLQQVSGGGDLTWNIVSREDGMSWRGDFSSSTSGVMRRYNSVSKTFEVQDTAVIDFLSDAWHENNYLILFNSHASDGLSYSLDAPQTGEFFTKPRLTIISSWKIGSFKQNLRTVVDNTEYLGILKYSLYSN